jgi:hypothetical protein
MQVIMISRLHAMYQRSRIMLIFLVIVFLAVNIACGVIASIALRNTVGGKLYLLTWIRQLIGQTSEELILSGTYICNIESDGAGTRMMLVTQVLTTAWEVLALCSSVWIAVKHFHDLRQLGPSTGLAIGGCFRVLMKSHVLYFARWAYNVNVLIFVCSSSARASFVSVSIVQFISLSPEFFVRRPVTDISL